MGWIQHKQSCRLDARYKLPKMKYKGDMLRTQRIRVDKKQLVTDMGEIAEEPEFPLLTKASTTKRLASDNSSNTNKAINTVKTKQQINKSSTIIEEVIQSSKDDSRQDPSNQKTSLDVQIEYVNRPVESIKLIISGFNQQIDESHVKCQIRGRTVRVKIQNCELIEQQLLFAIDSLKTYLEINNSQKILTVHLAYLNLNTYLQLLEQNQPHKLGDLGMQSQAYMQLDV
eukprot:TRINITY_DN15190_c0_g1_i1.p2 TRINITY_DN15190_c0_g1~~TRINITY_DN15190_c0_g1_i1.p2  ORF type:complete len:244 (+),score=18.06 TRINITY_DN15190_c0_g1_i1:51-734(+)